MSHTRTLLLGIAGLLAGWFLTSFLFSSTHSEPENSNNSQSNQSQRDKEIQYEKATKIDQPTSQYLYTNKEDAPTIPTKKIVPITEPNDISKNSQNSNIPQVPFTSTLAGMFYTEPTDEQWASETKLKLENHLTVEAPLRGAEIKSVECKSTACKVITVIHSKDARQLDKILHELMRDIMIKQREYFEPNIMSVREKDNTFSIYVKGIHRDDHEGALE